LILSEKSEVSGFLGGLEEEESCEFRKERESPYI